MAKPVGSQWEGNPLIKNTMLKPDVLDLNGENKTASKQCDLAAQLDHH
jgi:hypothetical protein